MGWLEIIPAMRLARGLPVVRLPGEMDGGVRCVVVEYGQEGFWFCHGTSVLAKAPAVRVDLDDPQGFGYALRVFRRKGGWTKSGALAWLLRHLDGKTTDADKLALAKALSEAS